MSFPLRCSRLASSLTDASLDGLLVGHLPNLRYLSGFTGSAGLLIVEREAEPTLIVDSRYVTQAGEESASCRVHPVTGTYEETLARFLETRSLARLGYEELHLKVAQLRFLESSLGERVTFVPTRELVEGPRRIKDAGEIAALARAASGLAPVLDSWRARIEPGVTEKDLAAELEYLLRRSGYERVSFETIVASGPRSALPHGRPTDRRLRPADVLVVDFGGVVEGYASDVTRTFAVGEPDPELARVYEIVAAAQKAAIDQARPGVPAGEVDRAAREVIGEAGYGAFFGHSTGHGLGLEVHEAPWIRPQSEEVLRPGMVFTVEPGIYLPGRGGVRIEDDVLLTGDGRRILSRGENELQGFSWVC